jgi:hypothetical protein
MARVLRRRRRRYSPSAGWQRRVAFLRGDLAGARRTTGCLSRPTRAAGSSRGRPPPAVFGPAALARVLGAPATSVSEARTRRTNEQPAAVSSSLTRLNVAAQKIEVGGWARGLRASHHPLDVTVIVTTPGRAGTLMVRCSARGVTDGTLVEAGSGAGGCPRFACSTRSSVFAILVSAYSRSRPLQKRTLVQ